MTAPDDVVDAGSPDAAPDGAVATLPERTGPRLWAPAASATVVQALEAGSAVVVDSPEEAAFAVVSTRLARHRVGEYTALAHQERLPVIVLVHPGGESLAVEALRTGGQMAIAEGDADAIRALAGDSEEIDHDARTDALLDAFEASLGRTQTTARTPVTLVDPTSGLPATGALQMRLGAAGTDFQSELRIVTVSIPALGERLRIRLGADAHAILHRRLAGGLHLLCAPYGDLYDNGDGSFVLLAHGLDIVQVERLGRRIVEFVEAYMPDGHMPLTVAVGHAGAECSLDPMTLRELAGRAELAARQEERSTVLGAGELVKPLATATELEVTLRLAELAGDGDAAGRAAVAALAAQIAARLGFEGRERLLVRFCASVAGIGAALSDDTAEQMKAATTMVGAVAGPAVAASIEAFGERWDGSGPLGLSGPAIPAPARIIAVAARLVADGNVTAGIEAGAGTEFDPTVVQAALEVVTPR